MYKRQAKPAWRIARGNGGHSVENNQKPEEKQSKTLNSYRNCVYMRGVTDTIYWSIVYTGVRADPGHRPTTTDHIYRQPDRQSARTCRPISYSAYQPVSRQNNAQNSLSTNQQICRSADQQICRSADQSNRQNSRTDAQTVTGSRGRSRVPAVNLHPCTPAAAYKYIVSASNHKHTQYEHTGCSPIVSQSQAYTTSAYKSQAMLYVQQQ